MFRPILAAATALVIASSAFLPAQAGSIAQRTGWAVHDTDLSQTELFDKLKAAAKTEGLFVVTRAGPTKAAANRGITIPENMVVGLFNNHFAVRAIEASVPAMIEAPIRMYLTGDGDGTSTLSYKLPSFVFSPYMDEGGPALAAIAAELDAKFAAIAAQVLKP